MQKNIIISLILFIFLSCAGSNATSMEYRSATTAVRSERNLSKGEEYALKALNLEIHKNCIKKVINSNLICIPSTSASVAITTLL